MRKEVSLTITKEKLLEILTPHSEPLLKMIEPVLLSVNMYIWGNEAEKVQFRISYKIKEETVADKNNEEVKKHGV